MAQDLRMKSCGWILMYTEFAFSILSLENSETIMYEWLVQGHYMGDDTKVWTQQLVITCRACGHSAMLRN